VAGNHAFGVGYIDFPLISAFSRDTRTAWYVQSVRQSADNISAKLRFDPKYLSDEYAQLEIDSSWNR